VGLFLLLRPRLSPPDTTVTIRPPGSFKRKGDWQLRDEEIWMTVGDVDLDLTRAEIPPDETTLRIFGFVGDVELLLSADTGFTITSTAFLTNAEVLGKKEDTFLVPMTYTSENYESARRKVRLETLFFVAELEVEQY
jgi:lia operon protein LiaF